MKFLPTVRWLLRLALPLLLLASFAVFFSLFFVASVGLATASQDQLQASLEKFNLPTGVEDVKHFQQISAVCCWLMVSCTCLHDFT